MTDGSTTQVSNSTPARWASSRLIRKLHEQIHAQERISVHDWMQAALYDPDDGYYCRGDLVRWGRTGDYLTSPSLSPLFAATFARYFSNAYEQFASPAHWTIHECGAGNGDFADQCLATLAQDYAHVFSATRYLVDELSQSQRKRLAQRLVQWQPKLGVYECGCGGPEADAGVIFANELLDAFPVHRVVMRACGLRELFVGLDATGNFSWIEAELTTPDIEAYLERVRVTLQIGQYADINLEVEDWLAHAVSSISQGLIVIVDYGAAATDLFDPETRPLGTLRTFAQHELSLDALRFPGSVDITTSVDWTNVVLLATRLGLQIVEHERQDRFLIRHGLLEILDSLSEQVDGVEVQRLRAQARELILPGGMGASFSVLVLRR